KRCVATGGSPMGLGASTPSFWCSLSPRPIQGGDQREQADRDPIEKRRTAVRREAPRAFDEGVMARLWHRAAMRAALLEDLRPVGQLVALVPGPGKVPGDELTRVPDSGDRAGFVGTLGKMTLHL